MTKRFCFRPFDVSKWFVFAFMVWIAEIGEGSNFSSFDFPGGDSGKSPLGGMGGGEGESPAPKGFQDALDPIRDWLHDHLGIIIAVAGPLILVGIAVLVAMTWLSSRGHMMALRAVATGGDDLGEHWRETRAAAWSYFVYRVLLAVASAPLAIGILVWAASAFLGALRSRDNGPMDFVVAMIGPVVAMIVFALLTAPLHFLGRTLLAPMLLKFGGGLRPNVERTIGVVRASPRGVAMFLLVRIGIAIAQGIAEVILNTGTCCMGALPVIHQAFTAPLHVFERAYTLCVFESLGDEYRMFGSQRTSAR